MTSVGRQVGTRHDIFALVFVLATELLQY